MDLTEGCVWKKLIRFTLPLILTMLLSQVYILSDSIIVSNYIGETALAIISPSSQALSIFQCVSLGIGVAVSIIIANLAGRKDHFDLKGAAKTFVLISFLLGIVLSGLAMALGYPLFLLLNVPESIFEESYSLYFIYVWSILTGIVGNILTTILTSIGDSKRPFIVSMISGLANIGLDLLFLKVFAWGISSCAYATLIAQFLVIVISSFMVKKEVGSYEGEKGKYSWRHAKEMFHLGIPSIIQQAVMSIGSMAIVSLIYSYGTEIIAGNVVAEEINSLLYIPVVAITNAYATFASQNYGAGKQDRIEEGFKHMHILAFIVNSFVCLVALFSMSQLIYWFTNSYESDSFVYAKYCLLFSLPYYYFIAFKYGFDSLFKAKKQIHLFIYSSFANLGLRIAFAYLFAYTLGVNFINLSLPISTLLSGIANVFFWKFSRRYREASEAIKT